VDAWTQPFIHRLIARTTEKSHALSSHTGSSAVVEALEAQSSFAWSLAEMTHCRSQSFGARSLLGTSKTSSCELHVTDREGCGKSSTCVLHVTDREGFCQGASSGSEGRTKLRRKREESGTLLRTGGLRGFSGICRNQATMSMLWGVVDSFKQDGRMRLHAAGRSG
jgi:hypothetical protein